MREATRRGGGWYAVCGMCLDDMQGGMDDDCDRRAEAEEIDTTVRRLRGVPQAGPGSEGDAGRRGDGVWPLGGEGGGLATLWGWDVEVGARRRWRRSQEAARGREVAHPWGRAADGRAVRQGDRRSDGPHVLPPGLRAGDQASPEGREVVRGDSRHAAEGLEVSLTS